MYTKLASAIYNDIYSGLQGFHINNSLSIELLEDEINIVRLHILKEYQLKGILPIKDLLRAINCIEVDCEYLERCPDCRDVNMTTVRHFEIPQLLNDFGHTIIDYIGTTDRLTPFDFYIGSDFSNKYIKYRKRGRKKPYVYIDPVPNVRGMYDGFIFNAPYIKNISIVAVFKDLRLLDLFNCCVETEEDSFNFIDEEIRLRIVKEKLQYYRLFAAQPYPNTQTYK